MACLLFAWEIGAGLGHSVPLAQVAAPLLAQGHTVHFALRDLASARTALGALAGAPRVHLWQAPVWLDRYQSPQAAASYAELLFPAGYLDAERLLGLAQGWRSLLDALQPDLLLADHAPTALLAARGWQRRDTAAPALQRALIGNGYFMPPALQPMPALCPWDPVPASRLAQGEALVLATCNLVLRALGGPALAGLHDLLAADATLLLTWSELDPWAHASSPGVAGQTGLAGRLWIGPLAAAAGGAAPDWPAGSAPRVFAYLRGDHPAIDAVLSALARAPYPTLAYVPGLPAAQRQRHAGAHLRFSERAVDLSLALPQAAAVVCLGGAGTVGAALRAGRPLLMLPAQSEQVLTALRVKATGAGLVLGTAEAGPQLLPTLQALLARAPDGGLGRHAAAAAALSQKYAVQSADLAGAAAWHLAALLPPA